MSPQMSDPLMDSMLSSFENLPSPPMGCTESNSSTNLSSEIQALRQRLLYATLEKETLRTNAMNELRLKEDCFPITSTDSNNHSSYISSPVDSIFDFVVSSAPSDHLDHLMNSRPLPEVGKLMQAVADAGPVLKTLLVSGPLPRWWNPPPLPVQTVQMPPTVGLRGRKRPLMPAPEMSGFGPHAKRLLKEVLSGC
ncbi:hypothetical protein QJS10_CPB14g01464 [Acorus calamus]|uniref:Uncharacterized protein n=1 Tax=Acorus calamus TaxID=4465 RepID=A0AAV9DCN6_ACOCL|nr:hypothetical protein QJS10_CPB14g01464 [Acorus calamus]